MPTYDYSCRSCGHTFEVFEAISASTRKACPKCSKRTARRMIGAGAGLVFKGSGFYITDYARPGSGKPAEKQGGCAAGGCGCAPTSAKGTKA
ncbi:MAG: zinc ribbon domain-containing protein [Planctomycetia bacterium]|nr:zinc ribbon domain-containing protein [Planctomycetia bacterium]